MPFGNADAELSLAPLNYVIPVDQSVSASLLGPICKAAPALFVAVMRCLAVLYSGDMGEARSLAICQAENALRLGREDLLC